MKMKTTCKNLNVVCTLHKIAKMSCVLLLLLRVVITSLMVKLPDENNSSISVWLCS